MDGSLIEFDVENQRLGIVESECDYIYATSGKRAYNTLDSYASTKEMNAYVIKCVMYDSFSSVHVQFFIMCAILSSIYAILQIKLQFRFQRRRAE
jgi:hypothetical protein